jgi:hypothetical protein
MLLLCCCLPLSSVADDVLLRASVGPADAWIGQRVKLQFDVLGADGWAQISRFGELDLSGAYLIRTESQGTRLQESIDGVSYTGQRYEVSVYPQRSGVIEVPALPVEITLKTWGAESSQTVLNKQTPVVQINAAVPPGAENVGGLISAPRFSASQQWSPTIEEGKVGDALQRTVTLQADDVSAMAFPPIVFEALPGVGVYPAAPEVEDATNRGTLQSRRTETVTYVFEREGRVRIPDIQLVWWNVSSEVLETAVLPGREIQISPGPIGSAQASVIGTPWRTLVTEAWYLVLAFLAVVGLLVRSRRALLRRWSGWCRQRRESEARYFKRARRSARSGDARRALRDVMRWLDRLNDGEAPVQLQRFARHYAGEDARVIVEMLLDTAATDGRLSEPRAVIELLNTLRQRWRNARRPRPKHAVVLPELNH